MSNYHRATCLHRFAVVSENFKKAPVRAKLIKKGMIYSPAHGELAFTVPLFNEFMIRAIPNLKSQHFLKIFW